MATLDRTRIAAVGRSRVAISDAWRAFLVSRVVIWAAGVAAIGAFGLSKRTASFDPGEVTRPFGPVGDALVGPAARWDAVWYLAIAQDGYAQNPARPAFFPLYPLLVSVAGAVVREPVVAGVLVSCACFAGALVLLRRLTALELGDDAARATTWLVALSPMAFFFSAVYSESLFLLVSVGSVYAARTGRWGWAGTLGFLAALTRSAGLLLLLPLVLLAWRDGDRRQAAWGLMVPAGLAVFCVFLELDGSGFGAAFDAQDVWYRSWGGPFAAVGDGAVAAWDGLRQLASGSRTPVYFRQAAGDPFSVARQNLMLFAFLVAAVPCVVGTLRRLPLAYGAYAVTALALPLSYPVGPQPLMSLPRFLAVVFPLWMWLGWWTSRGGRVRQGLVYGTSCAALVVFTAIFSTWHWVA